jgi:hypothetical protein
MNPDLEFFLESAFAAIEPSSSRIGRVVVEPDYDVSFAPEDRTPLRNELIRFLESLKPDQANLESFDGFEASIGANYPILKKYVRRISLHAGRADGDWIEVMPPGNWI